MSSTDVIDPIDPLTDNCKYKLFRCLDIHLKEITQMRQECATELATVEDKLIQEFAQKLNVESSAFLKDLSNIKPN